MKRFETPKIAAALIGSILLAASAPAKIDLATLPERGDVELTIYNSADLTLARETRAMSFKEGENSLQFSWANTLIDPTSVHLRLVEGEDRFEIEDISYPANTANMMVWTIAAEEAGEGVIEISYFTSGITWAADYVATADNAEKTLSLDGYVKVTNNSGEDYLNAKTRLLVGEINLVEAIAVLATSGEAFRGLTTGKLAKNEVWEGEEEAFMDFDMGMAADEADGAYFLADAKEVAKEGVSEYFLFTIEGREDLENGLSKRLPSFEADEVPFDLTYVHDPRRFGPGIAKLYKLKNEKPEGQDGSALGEAPLPNGFYQVFREASAGGLAYLGRHDDEYVPVGEDLEIDLGSDGLLSFEDVRRAYRRMELSYSGYGDVQGWDDIEGREVVVRNSKREAAPVEIRRTFSGDFDFQAADADKWEKISETEYELKATVGPLSEARFPYALRTRQGANAKK